jgi:hypothetical protein
MGRGFKACRKIGEQAWPDQTRFEPRIRHQYKSAWPHHLGSNLDPSVKQQASAKTDDASYRLFLPCCRWSAMEPTNKVFVRCWGGSIYCTYVAMTSKVPRCISDKKAITISKQCSACITVFGRTGPKKRCIYMETIRGFGSCVNLIISPRIVSLGLQPRSFEVGEKNNPQPVFRKYASSVNSTPMECFGKSPP